MTRDSYLKQDLPIKKYLNLFFKSNEELCIFDIGSCEGIDTLKYATLFPNSLIYAIEPIEENMNILKENIRKYDVKNIRTWVGAFSNNDGYSDFYISSGNPANRANSNEWNYGNKSSSVLEAKEIKKTHPWLTFNNKIKIKTLSLDTFCKNKNIKKIDIVHMDVQGAELMVLQGGKKNLTKIKMVWLEVSEKEFYKGQPLKKEIENYMKDFGFKKWHQNIKEGAGDQLYINKSILKFKHIAMHLLRLI